MAVFKEMDEQILRALLEGQEDVLTPLVNKQRESFSSVSCPNCRAGEVEPILDIVRPFSPGNPLPNSLMKCLSCWTEFNPSNGTITKVTPSPA